MLPSSKQRPSMPLRNRFPICPLPLGLALLLLVPAARAQTSGADGRPPNVLFLFADDQRAGEIAALGNPYIETPNLDRLVREGTAFTNAYVMGSDRPAVCAPSRAVLMTGRTLFHAMDEDEGYAAIPEAYVILPERLREAGYRTFGTGKQHNGRAVFARGFTDAANVFFGGMSDHYAVPLHAFDSTGAYPDSAAFFIERHSSALFSDAAVEFLEGYDGAAPFFMYVSYTAPHDPRTAPEDYHARYDPSALPLPGNFLPEHPFDNGELKIRDEQLAPWPRTPEIVRDHLADYYAMITHLDAEVGRVLDALEASGEADNTLIVFAGDNGLAVGQHGLLGKQNLYEHSVGVPLLFKGPGVPAGETRDAFALLTDVYPTLVELLGLSVPETVEGKSLVPVLRDPRADVREALPFAYRGFQRGLRDGRLKLIEYAVGGNRHTQLFDLEQDPWELKNLADRAAYAEDLARLRRELLRWKSRLNDPYDEFWSSVDTTGWTPAPPSR